MHQGGQKQSSCDQRHATCTSWALKGAVIPVRIWFISSCSLQSPGVDVLASLTFTPPHGQRRLGRLSATAAVFHALTQMGQECFMLESGKPSARWRWTLFHLRISGSWCISSHHTLFHLFVCFFIGVFTGKRYFICYQEKDAMFITNKNSLCSKRRMRRAVSKVLPCTGEVIIIKQVIVLMRQITAVPTQIFADLPAKSS